MIIAIIIVAAILNGLYHKIFDVVYFSFAGLVKEWTVCICLAALICSLFFG